MPAVIAFLLGLLPRRGRNACRAICFTICVSWLFGLIYGFVLYCLCTYDPFHQLCYLHSLHNLSTFIVLPNILTHLPSALVTGLCQRGLRDSVRYYRKPRLAITAQTPATTFRKHDCNVPPSLGECCGNISHRGVNHRRRTSLHSWGHWVAASYTAPRAHHLSATAPRSEIANDGSREPRLLQPG